MWTVGITSPAHIKLRMSQNSQGHSQIKRKWDPINDYRFFYNKTATSSLYCWSWTNMSYITFGKCPSVECSRATRPEKASALSADWQLICSRMRHMTPVAVLYRTVTLMVLFSAALIISSYHVTRPRQGTQKKCLTMATTSHLILQARPDGYFKKSAPLS